MADPQYVASLLVASMPTTDWLLPELIRIVVDYAKADVSWLPVPGMIYPGAVEFSFNRSAAEAEWVRTNSPIPFSSVDERSISVEIKHVTSEVAGNGLVGIYDPIGNLTWVVFLNVQSRGSYQRRRWEPDEIDFIADYNNDNWKSTWLLPTSRYSRPIHLPGVQFTFTIRLDGCYVESSDGFVWMRLEDPELLVAIQEKRDLYLTSLPFIQPFHLRIVSL